MPFHFNRGGGVGASGGFHVNKLSASKVYGDVEERDLYGECGACCTPSVK